MTTCAIYKTAGLALGIGSLAQIPVSAPLDTFKEFGITGLLILAILGLWFDSKRTEKAAQERRDKREEEERKHRAEAEAKADTRMEKFCSAIEEVNQSVKDGHGKCGVNEYLLEQLRRIGK
jgi:hypothetical protein